ncbi:MAG: ATP-binding protein [Candidatus Azobacteroides sp.]|nr:ATP-binding protein [Candidatus Azobacteroides sp.]
MFDRKITEKIKPFLAVRDILLFYGARQVGKTSLMKVVQKNYVSEPSYFFDLENLEYLDLLNKNPELFVAFLKSYHNWTDEKRIIVFIDEIQYLDNPTNFLKYIYDNYPNIKLIVSGSSTLEIRGKLKDSLVGRLIKFEVFPLSFEEFLVFKGKQNLANMIGKTVDFEIVNNELRFYYEEFITFGSYPKVVLANDINLKKAYLKQIYDTYIQKDIKDIGKIRELEKFNKLIRILANQAGNLVNISELSKTVGATINTINEWIFLLENTFVIKQITPFSNNLRGELTKMPKIFFVDTGLKNCIENTYEITGSSFENSFFAYINNAYKTEKINFYRTQDKKEIDFVLDGVPYELKQSFSGGKLTALDYFQTNYGQKGNVVTLHKKESVHYNVRFAWEV